MKHGSLFSGIYEIMNTTTKQCYIGSSINVYKRISSHVSMLRNRKHPNIKLQRSFNKYGELNFTFLPIKQVEADNLILEEQKHVDKIRPYFNIRKVVDSSIGVKLSEETKRKMSQSKKGKPLSEAQKAAIDKLHKKRIGVPVTGKTKESLLLGPISMIGKPKSESTKEKIRLSKIGKKFNKETRKYE